MSGQIGSSKSLYSGLTVPCISTSWRTLLEFLILWRRPSCSGSYKNIFHQVYNLTDQRTYSNPVRHFLTFSYISRPAETNTFSKKTPPFPLALQMKVLWWRYHKHQPSRSYLKHKEWHSLIKELGLDWVTNVIPWKKSCMTEFGLQRVCFANLSRSTWQGMSRRLDSKLQYSLFHLWMYRLQDFLATIVRMVRISKVKLQRKGVGFVHPEMWP